MELSPANMSLQPIGRRVGQSLSAWSFPVSFNPYARQQTVQLISSTSFNSLVRQPIRQLPTCDASWRQPISTKFGPLPKQGIDFIEIVQLNFIYPQISFNLADLLFQSQPQSLVWTNGHFPIRHPTLQVLHKWNNLAREEQHPISASLINSNSYIYV